MIIVNNSQHATLEYKIKGKGSNTLKPLTRTRRIHGGTEVEVKFKIPASGFAPLQVEEDTLVTVDLSVFNPIPADQE